jgi:hypothetical protein
MKSNIHTQKHPPAGDAPLLGFQPAAVEKIAYAGPKAPSVLEKADTALLNEQFAEAEGLYRYLIVELERLLGHGHPEVAEALHKLAAAVAGQGRDEHAVHIEERAQDLKLDS